MPYYVLLPDNFGAAVRYPVILFLHQYAGDTSQPAQASGWFNTDAFRARHPAIIVLPFCKIGTQRSTATFNWGGVDANLQKPIVYALAILELVVAKYGADRARLYVTGNSMGGLGTWGILANPAQRGRFAAFMPVSGSCYYMMGKEAQLAQDLRDTPVWSIHGTNDTQVRPDFDQKIMPLLMAINPKAKFTNIAGQQHDAWDPFYPKVDGWDWMFSQSLGGPVIVVEPLPPFVRLGPTSPDNATVTVGGTLYDTPGHAWTITTDGRVAYDGVADPLTANVVSLVWSAGVLWQSNAAGRWYSSLGNGAWAAGNSPLPQPPPVPGAGFSISGGKIIDPDGKTFPRVGININDNQMSVVATDARCEPLLKYFPGLNMLRIACRSYAGPDNYRDFIAKMTAKRIVMLFEDHTGISKPPYVGAALAAEVKWYADLAAAFKDNPYVWFGGFNEPGKGVELPVIQAQNAAIYFGIRASSRAIFALSLPSGGNKGTVGPSGRGYDGSVMGDLDMIKSWTGVIIDLHNYGWLSDYSTDPAVIRATLLGLPPTPSGTGAAAAQLWQSADGVVPVLCGEFGNSTTGKGVDKNGVPLCQVTMACAKRRDIAGALAWHWHAASDAYEDQCVSDNGTFTAYGKLIAGLIADAVGGVVIAPPLPSPLVQLRVDVTALAASVTAITARLAALGG
jgi:dienelactone hydrolase